MKRRTLHDNRKIADLIVELYSGDVSDTPATLVRKPHCGCGKWRTQDGCLHDRVKAAVRWLYRRG